MNSESSGSSSCWSPRAEMRALPYSVHLGNPPYYIAASSIGSPAAPELVAYMLTQSSEYKRRADPANQPPKLYMPKGLVTQAKRKDCEQIPIFARVLRDLEARITYGSHKNGVNFIRNTLIRAIGRQSLCEAEF